MLRPTDTARTDTVVSRLTNDVVDRILISQDTGRTRIQYRAVSRSYGSQARR